jgi:hypothetical protein
MYHDASVIIFIYFTNIFAVPRMFAIWWTAWNDRDSVQFSLPVSIRNITINLPPGMFLIDDHQLENGGPRESEKGIILRRHGRVSTRSKGTLCCIVGAAR